MILDGEKIFFFRFRKFERGKEEEEEEEGARKIFKDLFIILSKNLICI